MNLNHDRVRANTAKDVLMRIDLEIENNIRYYATQSRAAIAERIEQLEAEWDIERVLQANAAVAAGTGLALGAAVNKKWLWLTAGVLAFLFQHAAHGWCPPMPVLRRMGVRTRSEIDREKYALKALRGDFEKLAPAEPKNQVLRAHDVLRAVAL